MHGVGGYDWGTSRRRLDEALSRLAQLAEQGHPIHRRHLRRVLEDLDRNAQDLEGRRASRDQTGGSPE
ncbi:MAG TPA: hypothetical protein VKA48_12530, partial [Gammaproteobacteria bacterium]|nr:hypothetical protein [Gammaproteobacteria bacterium]